MSAAVSLLSPSAELAASLAKPLPLLLPPGLHPNIPAHRYHERRLGLVRKTALSHMARSPAHYRAWATCESEEDETPALSLGRAAHMAILEPELFANEYIIAPEFGDCRKTDRTTSEQAKENKTRRDAWRAEHTNHSILSDAEGKSLMGMIGSLRAHPRASRLLAGGMPEATVAWRDAATGLECRLRADLFRRDLKTVIDVKSTTNASLESFRRDIAKYGYGIQDVHYRSGFAAIGEDVRHFIFVPVEKTPPYAVGIYTLDAVSVARTYEKTRGLMRTMAECLESGVWPAYDDTIQEISLPPWA